MTKNGVLIRHLREEEAKDVSEMVRDNLWNVFYHETIKRSLNRFTLAFFLGLGVTSYFIFLLTGRSHETAMYFSSIVSCLCSLSLFLIERKITLRLFNDSFERDMKCVYEHYRDVGRAFLVAEVDGAIAGTVAIDTDDTLESAKTGELRRMAVFPGYRGRSISKLLLSEAEDFCMNQGYENVNLSTSELQIPAIKLYTRSGYVETGRMLIKILTFSIKMHGFQKQILRTADSVVRCEDHIPNKLLRNTYNRGN